MKSLTLTAILAGWMMTAAAQSADSFMKLSPTRIHPSYPFRATEGDKALAITWYPDSAHAPAQTTAPSPISAILYVYDTLYHWHVYEKALTKTGDTAWTTRIEMPAAAGFIAYKFKVDNAIDNNNDTGYFTMIYRKDGAYMPGAEAGYGLLRSPRYKMGVPDYFENFSISDTATYMWMSNEILRHHGGSAALSLVLPYLESHRKYKPESTKQEADRALHFLLSQNTGNEESLLKAFLVCKNILNDSLRTDSIRRALLNRFPSGALARKEAYDKTLKATTMEDRLNLSRNFVKDFPYHDEEEHINEILDIQYYPIYRNITSITLATKRPEIAFGYIDNLPFENLPELYYKSVEIPYDDWKTMDAKTAFPYSEALYRRILFFYDHQPATKWYYAPSEWKSYCDGIFASNFRLHARILMELGRDKEALDLARREQEHYQYKSSDLNQTEAILLNRTGQTTSLDTLLKISVRNNQVTPLMMTWLKQHYTKTHGSDNGFDAWLESMKDEKTRQLMKEDISRSRLDLAAPDFSLLDNQGRTISLKDLRGKVVVLDLWATWCAPCKAGMAGMNMALAKYKKDTGVVFLFIDTQERTPDYKDKGLSFLKENGYPFQVLYDMGADMGQTYHDYAKALHTSGIPFKAVIDQQGRLRYANIGYKGSPSGLADEISVMIELAKHDGLSYHSDSIFYENRKDTIRIGATLSYPLNGRARTAVVFLSGTGKQDRDGTMAGHQLFALLADSLTRRGFAVLRSDDRGTGQTNGDYDKATTADFADDAISAVDYLRSRKDLHLEKIGLLGHSEGGMAAAIAAAKDPAIDFVISLSSPGQRGLEALLTQNKNIVATAPIPAINKLRFDSVNNLLFHIVYNNAGKPDLEQRLRTAYASWKTWDYSLVKANKLEYGGHFFFPFETYVRQATGRWYQYFITYDPARTLPKIQVPYLAINGDKDIISDGPVNLKGIRDNLAKGGNTRVTTWLVPGLNHLYQHCNSCSQSEYATLKETMAPEVVTGIGEWLQML